MTEQCKHDWKTDPFGPWVCRLCGGWSVTEQQARLKVAEPHAVEVRRPNVEVG